MAYLCSLSVVNLRVTRSRQRCMSPGLLGGFLGNVALILKSADASLCSCSSTGCCCVKKQCPSQHGHLAALGEPHWSNASVLGKTKQEDERSLGLWWHCKVTALTKPRGGLHQGPLSCEMTCFLYFSKLISLKFSVTYSKHCGDAHHFFPSQWGKQIVKQRVPVTSLQAITSNQTSQSWRKSTLNIHWKDWCWSSNTLANWYEVLTHWSWERLRAGEVGDRGWDSWMASSTQWTWAWANSGRQWKMRKPGMLQLSDWTTRI